MRKYKIGDKVIMEERSHYEYSTIQNMRKHNHVFTIIGFCCDKYYDMKESPGAWQDCHIIKQYDDEIDSRFEILDL